MSDTLSQQRRSRRFSFTSRRQEGSPPEEEEEVHHGPPVTTIGFPIELYPEHQPQEPVGPAWKRAFRRSQSVDRNDPSRASRRLVKKPPVNELRRDTSVSSQAPRKSMISSISTRIRSRRASLSNNVKDEDTTATGFQFTDQQGASNTSANSSQPNRHDRTSSRDMTQRPGHANQVPQQPKKDHLASKQEHTPTLRRVGSPFYHTASEKAAIARESPIATAYDAEWSRLDIRDSTANLELWKDESMIPASLRVGRSKMVADPAPNSPSRASLPVQENNISRHSLLPKYSAPADVPGHQEKGNNHFDSSLSLGQASLPTQQLPPKRASNTVEKTAESGLDRIRSPRPLPQNGKSSMHEWSSMVPSEPPVLSIKPVKTMSPRPKHAKTPSSSSSSSGTSSLSSSSTYGEPPTPISSNASTTHLENILGATTTNNSSNDHTSKKDVPRNTMSPKLDKYLAKIFVVCCHCSYWHDVPSGLYAKMIIPERLLFSGLPEPSETRSSKSSRSSSQARESTRRSSEHSKRSRRQSFVSQQSSGSSSYSSTSLPSSSSSSPSPSSRLPLSSPTATVQCSWCRHEMAQSCCASWTTMVHLIERHH